MAHLLRLSLWAVVAWLALCALPASAQTAFVTQEEADAFSNNVIATSPHCSAADGKRCDRLLDIPGDQPMYAGRYFVRSFSLSTGAFIQAFSYYFSEPAMSCEDRNDDPAQAPGTRLSLAQNSGPKCVGGCVLDIVGDPIETVPGRVQGQPVVYYRWNQTYTGDSCESDADPGDNAEDLEPTDTPEGEKQCNPSLGICINEDGENEYCTFNPDGTPSSCVPAVDYDNDGVNDDDDTQPDDPTNGSDEGDGDETDNTASGGAKCSHDGGGPPACKGDAIQCNILLQQYLARCSAEKVASGKVAGGIACSMTEALTCTNLSPAECWAKAMDKKAACAAEGIGQAITGALVDGEEGADVDPASVWVTPAEGEGEISLDMGGWLGSRACPVIPSFSVMGKTISFDSVRGDMCNFFAVGGMLVLLLAAYQCARILGET